MLSKRSSKAFLRGWVGGASAGMLLPFPRAVLESQCQVDPPALSLLLLPFLQVSQGCPAGQGGQAHLFLQVFLETHTIETECVLSRC